MLVTASRVTVRTLFFLAFAFCALLLLGGRAHALADDPPAATASGSTPADTATPTTIDTSETTPPPTVPESEPTAPTPAGASGPDDANTQGATVVTSGTSTANTGSNGAVATASTPPATTTGATDTTGTTTTPTTSGSTANAGTTTGTSAATGDQSTSAINQQVSASTTGNGTVDILQIALVVNVGVAGSTSGNNAAGASAGGSALNAAGSVGAGDTTGNAQATGDNAQTSVVQGAIVGNGQASNQTTTILNIGIAISNTGLNITIASIGGSSASMPDTAFANVATGNSSATGDRANSSINQNASASASGNAVVTIDQRAVVVNFGVAISNTGANFSLASLDESALTPEEQAIIAALLNSLVPVLFGTQSATPTGATAIVSTGGANSVGNATTTTIAQTAQGTASGSQSASVAQTAQVANFGIALANSGFNAALAGTATGGTTPAAQLAQAESSLDAFFANLTDPNWLQSANPFAAFAQTVEIDGVTFDLGGSLSANDIFVGFDSSFAPEDNAMPNGVHVRQVSGVLDIGIATSDSGDNTAVSSATGSSTGSTNGLGTAHMVLPTRQVGGALIVQRGRDPRPARGCSDHAGTGHRCHQGRDVDRQPLGRQCVSGVQRHGLRPARGDAADAPDAAPGSARDHGRCAGNDRGSGPLHPSRRSHSRPGGGRSATTTDTLPFTGSSSTTLAGGRASGRRGRGVDPAPSAHARLDHARGDTAAATRRRRHCVRRSARVRSAAGKPRAVCGKR